MYVSEKNVKKIESIEDFDSKISFDFENIVMVGSADVSLSDCDQSVLSSMVRPLFVYFNHASLSSELQDFYPSDYGEILFLRGGGGNLLGVDEDGEAWFSPKNKSCFYGVFIVNPAKEFFVKWDDANKVCGNIYRAVIESYLENEFGKKSPTTGYFAESMLRMLVDKRFSETGFSEEITFFTVGFGLSDEIKKTVNHNLDFERRLQKEKFKSGRLRPIGVISRSRVPVSKRVKPQKLKERK